MLRIGYDAKRLFHNHTGLGNYSRTLLQDLSQYFPQSEYHLYSPSAPNNSWTSAFHESDHFQIHTSKAAIPALWRSSGIKKDLQQDGIQLFHGLSHEIPLGLQKAKIPSVVTIHDLIFKSHPQLFPFLDRQIYDWKFRYSCEQADRVVAISESTKKDIIRYYKIAPEKIQVIYQTCDEQFKKEVPAERLQEVQKKYQLPQEYLLYVGSLIERKNLLGLIQGMEFLPASLEVPLVVIGNGAKYKARIQKYLAGKAMEKNILFLEDFHFPDLAAVYTSALALCYPSFYEGFGIPLIEALFCKTPVLTSRSSSLPEAAGSGAIYVDPNNRASITNGLEKLLDDDTYGRQLADAGHAHVQQFHSAPLAKAWMNLYENLV